MNNVYEGLNAYKTYLAIRNHFNTDYDYFKYNGKLKVSNDSFLKRRDKFFFAKLERNYRNNELVYFFVANFLDNDSSWSGSLVGSESEKKYKMKSIIKTLTSTSFLEFWTPIILAYLVGNLVAILALKHLLSWMGY